jgi:hypothetical protein
MSIDLTLQARKGNLEKKGQGKSAFGSTSWKKRYFILQDGELRWYEGYHSLTKELGFMKLNSKVKGNISMYSSSSSSVEKYVEDKKHNFTFKLVAPDRTLFLNGIDANDRDTWYRFFARILEVAADLPDNYDISHVKL